MRRGAVFLATVLLLLVLQAAVVRLTGLWLDVAALTVVYLALERAVVPGAALAGCVGYLNDIFAATPRGLYAVGAVLAFFTVRLVAARIAGSGPVFVSLLSALGTAVMLAGAVVVERILGPGQITLRVVVRVLPSLLIAAVFLGYLCHRFLARIDQRFKEPEDDLAYRS
jgi:rod shape-determining protein MreD